MHVERGLGEEAMSEELVFGIREGRRQAADILRDAAETAHATTAEILLRLAREIEAGE